MIAVVGVDHLFSPAHALVRHASATLNTSLARGKSNTHYMV
jgi:hypothetical protein